MVGTSINFRPSPNFKHMKKYLKSKFEEEACSVVSAPRPNLNQEKPGQIQKKPIITQAKNKGKSPQVNKAVPKQVNKPTTQVQNNPITTQVQNKAIITQVQNKPITTQVQNKPIIAQVQNKLITTQVQNKPITTQVQNKPITTQIQNKPIATQVQNNSITTQDQTKKGKTIQVTNKPTSIEVQNRTKTSQVYDKPTATVTSQTYNKPTATVTSQTYNKQNVAVQPPLPPDPPPPTYAPNVVFKKDDGYESHASAITQPKQEVDEQEDKSKIVKQLEEKPKKKELCRDFARGNCMWNPCKKSLEMDLTQLDQVNDFCIDFANDKCKRLNCRFVHATTFEKESYFRTGYLPPHLRPQISSKKGHGQQQQQQQQQPQQQQQQPLQPMLDANAQAMQLPLFPIVGSTPDYRDRFNRTRINSKQMWEMRDK
ncbi:microtubule-associated protein RP/EB family member 1-like [Amyelois transitella]|uniref:microtubule-associated protein RP/EB family member 1-like n=1 Tax=Amyelois transitella TaxID=680683 RepID=UPI00299030F4|nr:microtubule-associated protein RP/EB family member 1-like [Amyelois transitella]